MAVVVTLLITLTSNRLFDGMTTAVEQSQYDSMENVIVFNVEAAQSRALSRAGDDRGPGPDPTAAREP